MKTKQTVSVSEGRSKIFSIVDEVQKPGTYYTLTERGKPKAVVLSAEEFEKVMEEKTKDFFDSLCRSRGNSFGWESVLTDEISRGYGREKRKISGSPLVLRDGSEDVYSLAGNGSLKRKEEGYIKSLLHVELIEKYNYPFNLIELGKYVQIGGERKRYTEADIIVKDRFGNVKIVFEVAPFGDYEKNRDRVTKDLFDLAVNFSRINEPGRSPEQLVYFSQTRKNGGVKEKILVIDFDKFKSFSAWEKAGKPAGRKIPVG